MPQPGERLDRAEGTKPYREESRALDPREVTIKPGWNVRDMTSPATRPRSDPASVPTKQNPLAAKPGG